MSDPPVKCIRTPLLTLRPCLLEPSDFLVGEHDVRPLLESGGKNMGSVRGSVRLTPWARGVDQLCFSVGPDAMHIRLWRHTRHVTILNPFLICNVGSLGTATPLSTHSDSSPVQCPVVGRGVVSFFEIPKSSEQKVVHGCRMKWEIPLLHLGGH